MQLVKQNTAEGARVFLRATDTGLGQAGLASLIVITAAKAGAGSKSLITPIITDLGDGLYNLALTASHTDTLGVMSFHITAPNVIDNDELEIEVVAFDPKVGTNLSLSALPTANAGTSSGLPLKSDVDAVTTAVNAHTDSTVASIVTNVNAHTDVVGAAINAHTDVVGAAIIAAMPTPAQVRDAVLNAARAGFLTAGTVGEGIALATSLLQGNFYIDNVDNADPNGPTSQRLRCFVSPAAMAGVSYGGTAQGEFATFLVTTTYEGANQIHDHKVIQQ